MIAANGVTARYLAAKQFPSIRRVVQTPKRWDRIVALAQEHGVTLPAAPDSVALDAFLVKQRAADPARFPDLSLAVIKLLGAGEYVAEKPGEIAPGHFGLAVKDYTHSTAPNRRYPDLVTQRLLKAAIAGRAAPYSDADLNGLAKHFTEEEDAANKVERQVGQVRRGDAPGVEDRRAVHRPRHRRVRQGHLGQAARHPGRRARRARLRRRGCRRPDPRGTASRPTWSAASSTSRGSTPPTVDAYLNFSASVFGFTAFASARRLLWVT